MASPIVETQILSGDIFFQNGMYKKKLNVKTASNITYTDDIINLTQYSEGEPWTQVSLVYSIVEISAKQSEDVRSYVVKPKYLSKDQNIFKFVAEINGKNAGNRIAVSWFAREEIIDVQGEKFNTKESHNQIQNATFELQNQVGSLLSVTSDNGRVDSYELTKNNTFINVKLSNGTVYKTYSKPYRYEEKGKPGNYQPQNIKKISTTLWQDDNLGNMPFSGNLTLTSNVEAPQGWEIGQEIILTNDTTTNYGANTELQYYKDAILEQKYVVTRTVHKYSESGYPYTKHYTVYAKLYRRTILRNCVWTGNVYAQTYLYLVNVSYIRANNNATQFTGEDKYHWIPVGPEEIIQQITNTPPKVNSIVRQYVENGETYRYIVTKAVPINKDSLTHYTNYKIYGIKQMQVKINS